MNKISLVIIFVSINVLFAILLIHKQNTIVKLFYDLQALQKEKDFLLQEKKDLIFQLQKEQQLSNVQSFAKEQLNMKTINLKEAKTVPTKRVET